MADIKIIGQDAGGAWHTDISLAAKVAELGASKSIIEVKVGNGTTPGGFQLSGTVYGGPDSALADFSLNSLAETDCQFVMPFACTLKNLNIRSGDLDGSATTFTVRKNGVDTTLSVTTSGNRNTTTTDSTHSVSFSAGHLFTLKGSCGSGTSEGIVSISVEVDSP